MSDALQHVIVLTIVALCVAYVARQAFQTLRGKRSRVGNCCARGCGDSASPAKAASTTPKVAYIPVEMLTRKRKQQGG